MIVRLTTKAKTDLRKIGDYIARHDPVRAIEFMTELHAKCMQLAGLPRGFPLVDGLNQHSVRRRTYGNYVILYRIDDHVVVVLHVVHGARDYSEFL